MTMVAVVCGKCGTEFTPKMSTQRWCSAYCRNTNPDKLAYEAGRKASGKSQESFHHSHLVRTYGITRQDYLDMLEAQGGGCYLCGKTEQENGRSLAVDHNHSTGKVRGILCQSCNVQLGHYETTRSRADEFEMYLNIHN